MQGPEMNQFQGQFVMILEPMDKRSRINAGFVHNAQHQAQEGCVARDQRVVIGRAGDEIIGKVGAAV